MRKTTRDPLLVQAGRVLVPSPRAQELREQVARLVLEVESVLRPTEPLELKRLVRTFTLRTSEGFVENFGPALLAEVARDAPGVQLRFLPKLDKDSGPLRDGTVDLETGVIEDDTPRRVRALFEDQLAAPFALAIRSRAAR